MEDKNAKIHEEIQQMQAEEATRPGLTEQQLAEIWERWQDSHDGEWSSLGRNVIYRHANGGGLVADTKMGFRTKEDATFAAHAHQDIPALVMEVERLRVELELARLEALKEVVNTLEKSVLEFEQTQRTSGDFKQREEAYVNKQAFSKVINLLLAKEVEYLQQAQAGKDTTNVPEM